MVIIGCDFRTRYQQIATLDEATRKLAERRLEHENGEADTFYRRVPKPVRVGIEATGPMGGRTFASILPIEASNPIGHHTPIHAERKKNRGWRLS
jgi:hypothetical protein